MLLIKHLRLLFLAVLLFVCNLACAATPTEQCETVIKQGIAAMQNKRYGKALELFGKARDYAEKHHLDKQVFLSVMNIGNTYQNMFEYGEALDYFLEGYALAIKLEPKAEIMAIHNIANLYVLEEDYEKAGGYFKKAYETAKRNNAGDKLTGVSLSGMAYTIMLKGDLVLSRKYILEALQYLKDYPKESQTITIMLLNNTLQAGNTVKARSGAVKLYNNSPYPEYDDAGVNLLLIISKSYLAEGNYESATAYAQKILATNPELGSKHEAFNLLADIYTKNNNLHAALQYKDSVFKVQNMLNDIKNGRQFESNKVKFEVAQYKSEIAANEKSTRFEHMIFYFTLAVVVAIMLIGFLMLKQKRVLAERNRHQMLLELEKEKTNGLVLEKQVTMALLEQERLKNEVDARNRKLSAKALHLSGRNELMSEILDYLSKRPKYSKDITLAAYVESLKQHLKTDNDWNDFIAHFEEVNPGFLSRLKEGHPTLTVSDIRFLAYMYMKLSAKEIAFILNITTLASKKRKERLAAKMEIPKDTDLYDYIATL